MAADAGGVREARERAQAWLADTEAGGVTDRSVSAQMARDVLALAAALGEAEQRAEEAERRLEQSMTQSERAIENGNSALVGWRTTADKLALLAARLRGAEEALRVYADPRHWAIGRDDLNYRQACWIGPGAITSGGYPDAPETARRVLAAGGDTPEPADG